MPKVGNREFPYTKEGERQAAQYASESGQPVINENSFGYARGGEVNWKQKVGAMGAGLGAAVLTRNLSLGKQAAAAAAGGLGGGLLLSDNDARRGGEFVGKPSTYDRHTAPEIPEWIKGNDARRPSYAKEQGWGDPMLSVGRLDPENKGQIKGDPWLTVHSTGGGLLNPRGGEVGADNFNNLGKDNKLDAQMQVGNIILESLSPNISRKLDNTDQPYEMAKDLIMYSGGDIQKAAELAMQINKSFSEIQTEDMAVGDYWDYWTNELPEIYKKEDTGWFQRGGKVGKFGY